MCWNSRTKIRAWAGMFSRVVQPSPWVALFRLIQSTEMIFAKNSTLVGSCWASWTISMKAKSGEVASLSFSNWGKHPEASCGQDQRAWVVVSSSNKHKGRVVGNYLTLGQVHPCWEGVRASMPEQGANSIWDMEVPDFLPNILFRNWISDAWGFIVFQFQQQFVSGPYWIYTIAVYRPINPIRCAQRAQW